MAEGGGASTPGADTGGSKRRRRRRPRRGSAHAAGDAKARAASRGGDTAGDAPRSSGRTAPGAEPGRTHAGTGQGQKRKPQRKSPRKTQKKEHQKKEQKKEQKSQKQRQKRRGTSGKASRRPRGAPTKREISAGGVVYRRDGDEIEIVLASRRTRRGELAWGLAKGGIEDNESPEEAAVREVREETGLLAEIEDSLGETRYFYVWEDVRIRKTVHFFLMRHTGGNIDDRDDEMEEIRWFPLERALKRAAYRGERDVLVRAAEILR
ncbi:MAG TPA: NUDIX hydrolase [Actinomycetota bacterium]|nr:NUDIX hydrolase [Actinomycetota bacterium]